MTGIKERIDNICRINKDAEDADLLQAADRRDKQIVKTSIVGIIANVFLAAFKAIIGTITGSIAITLDAVNNLSDAASSIITIIGTKLAGKAPDKKHPFGYGRIEYLSAMVISLIVLYAGITSLQESVKKIITPEKPEYTVVSLIIVAAAVVVKIILGRYFVRIGTKVKSDSLTNSGKDATLDSVISASTLVAAGIFLISGISLESWLGAVISLVIIKSGIDMLRETLSEILGERADASLAKEIRDTVLEYPGVSGAYDLVLNNYGPDAYNGSIHIEVPDTYSADQIDDMTRKITYSVYQKTNVILTAISVYSMNTTNPKITEMREKIQKIAVSEEYVLQMHGFYVEESTKTIRLDLVVSFDSPDRVKVWKDVVGKIKQAYPEYHINAVLDTDFAES